MNQEELSWAADPKGAGKHGSAPLAPTVNGDNPPPRNEQGVFVSFLRRVRLYHHVSLETPVRCTASRSDRSIRVLKKAMEVPLMMGVV
jgi:hypothetical protein